MEERNANNELALTVDDASFEADLMKLDFALKSIARLQAILTKQLKNAKTLAAGGGQ